MVSYPLHKQLNSVRRCNVPPRDDQFGYPHVAGRRFEKSNFSNASCHPTTQFEDFNRVNADATDETKISPWILPRTIVILSAIADRPLVSLCHFHSTFIL